MCRCPSRRLSPASHLSPSRMFGRPDIAAKHDRQEKVHPMSIIIAADGSARHLAEELELLRSLVADLERIRLSPEPARRSQPGRGAPPARRNGLSEASGRAVGRLWGGAACGGGLEPEGRRHRFHPHALEDRARQGRARSQRHAVGRSPHPPAAMVGRGRGTRHPSS